METKSIYNDIARRTDGDIYIGVVGPVRTGKSTFIKKFMENVVIPNIESDYRRDRATDELPQSAAGKTIMTTEPKFIPEGKEIKRDFPGSGERPGKSPNPEEIPPGVAGYANRHRSSEGKEAGKLCQSG